MNHAVLGDIVAHDDPGGDVARSDKGAGGVGDEPQLVTRSRDGGGSVGKAGRVDDGTVEDVVEKHSGLLVRSGTHDGRLDLLNSIVGGCEYGDDRVIERVTKVAVVQELSELAGAKRLGHISHIARDAEDLVDRLDSNVLVLRTIRGHSERNVSSSQLNIGSVVTLLLRKNRHLAAVTRQHDVLGHVERGGRDRLVHGRSLVDSVRAIEHVVGDSSNEVFAVHVVTSKSLESLVGGGENGLVTSLKSAKKRLAVVADGVGERREVVGAKRTEKTLGKGSSIAAVLGHGTSGSRKSDSESSEELHNVESRREEGEGQCGKK